MTLPLTIAPRASVPRTFLNAPLVTDFDRLDAHIAVLGLPYGDPRNIDEVTNDQTQIDAYLDWRDEVMGAREGYSNPMRRASEMPHIRAIHQIGLRAQGSARREEVEAARAYGARIVTAYELHDSGMDAVLAGIPDGGRYYLTIDADGLDPSVMPAVAGPAPGGVTFHQARKLIHGLVKKGRVMGMDIVEITPRADVNQISCITAGRLIVNLIGAAVRAGYFDRASDR